MVPPRSGAFHHVELIGHGGDHGMAGLRVELGRIGVRQSEHVAGELDHHALQAQAQPEARNPVFAGVPQRPWLPSIPRMPKPPGTQIASAPASARAAAAGVTQSSLGTHRISTRRSFAMPPARSASVTDRDRRPAGRCTCPPTRS